MNYEPDSSYLNGILQTQNPRQFYISSSPALSGYEAEKALDATDSYFHTQTGGVVLWYCVIFTHFFQMKSYTIKSRSIHEHHPKEWKMIGSNNGRKWELIDEQNTTIFDSNRKVVLFNVKHVGTYKYINMTQTATTNNNNVLFAFGSIDFFGRVVFDYNDAKTCKGKRLMSPTANALLFIIITRH